MTILGIDPGTRITGVGILDVTYSSKKEIRILDAEAILLNPNDTMPLRLKEIFETLSSLIKKYKPNEVAIETMFYGKNAQSAMKLGHARGVAMLVAVLNDLPVAEYSPREVKKAVVGYGNASKEQVQAMVKRLLKLKATPKHFDVTDALAVALCHSHSRNFSTNVLSLRSASRFKNWKSFLENNPQKIIRYS
ncbi:MAG: crossover junction endodeoxyribonuclease RuvC [Ignavibacteriales bacterium]|nr:crossover junction endodeoxyribonuclease RuvC [Ignavibacteriales bacterium]